MGTAAEPPDGGGDASGGRIEQFRARAEAARRRYEELAQRQPLYGLPLTGFATYAARQGMLLASAIAFRLFFWVLPVLLFALAVLTGLGRTTESLNQDLVDATGLSGPASTEVMKALSSGDRSWWILAIGAFAGVLWTTMLLRRTLVLVNSHLWQTTFVKLEPKQLVLSVFFFVALVALTGLSARAVSSIDLLPGGYLVSLAIQTVVAGACWLAVMRHLPDRRSGWLDLLPGALVFGLGIALMHLVSRLYLPGRFAHSSALYGSLGVAAVILVWLLLFGQLVVWSAIVNVVWLDFRRAREAGDLAVAHPSAAPAAPSRPRSHPS
jgi:uncharacterized BrkB/YihY/UPF0761 family membrane protein